MELKNGMQWYINRIIDCEKIWYRLMRWFYLCFLDLILLREGVFVVFSDFGESDALDLLGICGVTSDFIDVLGNIYV